MARLVAVSESWGDPRICKRGVRFEPRRHHRAGPTPDRLDSGLGGETNESLQGAQTNGCVLSTIAQFYPMFDRNFILGAVALVAFLVAGLALSQFVGVEFRLVALMALLVAWGGLWWLDRHYSKGGLSESSSIFCEWGERLSKSDFLADTEMTRLGLQEHGLTLKTAIGREFTFETECDQPIRTVTFSGTICQNRGGQTIIRANDPEIFD